MEHQTRFDLNAALESWRTELAAQPNLTQDARRELETHLRDTIIGLRQCGLNDEEAFWLASRRTGQPEKLGEEFVKTDSSNIWRERVFWLGMALLMIGYWNSLTLFIRVTFPFLAGSEINSMVFYYTIFYGPIVWVTYCLVAGRAKRFKILGDVFLHSRGIFIALTVSAAVLVLGFNSLQLYSRMSYTSYQIVLSQIEWILFPRIVNFSALIAITAWLMPQKKTSKAALHS
ncbi:MAG TPA: hypothetical protein VGN23_06115 [Verrucomicrobiae bacterium]|jgi:hypothetical protein